MADTISRDAALEVIEVVKNACWSQSGKVLCGRMYSQIKDLPAVEAIPVNWINAYMNKAHGRVRAEIIREMLDAWTEQEAIYWLSFRK